MALFLYYFRKAYAKRLQLTHTYGDDDEEELLDENEARNMTENAIKNGTAPRLTVPDVPIDAPEGAAVTIGGKRCKWCNSTTHSRK